MKHLGVMWRITISLAFVTILPVLLTISIIKGIMIPEAAVIVFVCSGIIFISWIYLGFLRPVEKLKDAAKRIESGDLDFTLEAETDDEFGELTQSFEAMRIRLKASQEEKIRNDEENRELITNIAHDLKTPLTTIKGYAEGILDGVADSPERIRQYVQTIYNKSNDMNTLIDELNYYAKIETNRIPYNFQRLNTVSFFEDCADEIGIDMKSRGWKFSYENAVDPGVEMIADPEQLRKVINNIVSNSVKYMDKSEPVFSIRVKDEGDFVEAEFMDNGKGIARTDLPYIFERFFRADSSRHSMKGGSGIGLSIARKIVEDSGGRIWAQSEEGRGTVMHFVLRKYLPTVEETRELEETKELGKTKDLEDRRG